MGSKVISTCREGILTGLESASCRCEHCLLSVKQSGNFSPDQALRLSETLMDDFFFNLFTVSVCVCVCVCDSFFCYHYL